MVSTATTGTALTLRGPQCPFLTLVSLRIQGSVTRHTGSMIPHNSPKAICALCVYTHKVLAT